MTNKEEKIVFAYDYNGFFMGTVKADPCQIVEGDFIIPAFSTEIAPPECDEHHVPHFIDGEWVVEEKVVKKAEDYERPEQPNEITYRELRAAEYPDLKDYIDGVVKMKSNDPELVTEGESQIQAYVDECLAIKAKYPKPKTESEEK